MDGFDLPSNPQDDARPQILGATLAMTILSLMVVALRLYVRTAMIKSIGADDIIMAFSMALVIALEAIIIVECQHGHGRHIGDVLPERYQVGLKYNFISQPVVFICTNAVKLSVGAALLRIAATKFWKVLIWSIMGFMVFYTTGAFFTIIFQCRPIAMQWDPSVEGTCWEPVTLQALAYTSIALNMLTDLLFAIFIPLPMLWALNLNRRTKAALLFVLSLGVFACAAAAVRISYIARYGIRDDYLWDTRHITIWCVVEATVGIIAGSLPALKPLFTSIIGSTRRYAQSKTSRFRSTGKSAQRSSGMWKSKTGKEHNPATDLNDNESERGLNSGVVYQYPMDDYSKQGTLVTTAHSDRHAGIGEISGWSATDNEPGIAKTTTIRMSFEDER